MMIHYHTKSINPENLIIQDILIQTIAQIILKQNKLRHAKHS